MTLLTPELLPTKSYPFGALRHLLAQTGVQEMVVGLHDFEVTPRAAGANMSVDVAAGGAWISGDDSSRQGVYHQVNDATVNVPIAAADATNPRIDQIVLKVNDSSVVGTSDTPQLYALPGTPTPGANATNLSGVAALPGTAMRLAYVSVGAGFTTIIVNWISDRRAILDTGWVALTLAAGVVSYDAYTPSARLQLDRVTFKGSLQNTSGGVLATALATVPGVMQPADTLLFGGGQPVDASAAYIDIGGAIYAPGIADDGVLSLHGAGYTLR